MSKQYLSRLWFAIYGPTLSRIPGETNNLSIPYTANSLEKVFTMYINSVNFAMSLAKWTTFLWLPFTARRLYNWDSMIYCSHLFGYISTIYVASYIIRGLFRLRDASYKQFISAYIKAEDSPTSTHVDALTLYGFRYKWPAEFDVRSLDAKYLPQRIELESSFKHPHAFLAPIFWLFAHTIGVRMVYPGCINFINSCALESRLIALNELRTQFSARRCGILTRSGNFVETLYIDRRNETTLPNRNTLVICCEGNGSFAETGVSGVPLKKGFSILAWNHPGFGSSSGLPYPDQDTDAMEAVVLFAIHKLNFSLDNICLFGWSIGGYSVTWAGMHFPSASCMMLDATFDSLEDLSKNVLPILGETIPVSVVQNHFNLNNSAQIIRYPGPILLIRRDKDEIISTDPRNRMTNRGNFLLIDLLKFRFPHLFNDDTYDVLKTYLSKNSLSQKAYLSLHSISDEVIVPILQQHFAKETILSNNTPSLSFPSQLGQHNVSDAMKRSLLIFLASKYMIDVGGAHCSPLNPDAFVRPWSETTILTQSTNDFIE